MSQHYSDTIMHQSRAPTSDKSDTEVTSEAIDVSRTIYFVLYNEGRRYR